MRLFLMKVKFPPYFISNKWSIIWEKCSFFALVLPDMFMICVLCVYFPGAPLFDSSSTFIDPQTMQLLQHKQTLLSNLNTIFHCLHSETRAHMQKGAVQFQSRYNPQWCQWFRKHCFKWHSAPHSFSLFGQAQASVRTLVMLFAVLLHFEFSGCRVNSICCMFHETQLELFKAKSWTD